MSRPKGAGPSPEVRVRVPALLMAALDAEATRLGLSRAAVLRLCAELVLRGPSRRTPRTPTPGHGSQP